MKMDFIDIPLLEYDSGRNAIIEPSKVIKEKDVPKRCLMPFYQNIILQLRNEGLLEEIAQIESSVVPNTILYELNYKKEKIAVISPSLGAPYAAGNLEIAIAFGCRNFLSIGSCGVLAKDIARNSLIILDSAIRDEGTSYHYMPPSREIKVNRELVKKIKNYLDLRKVQNTIGKTWTTDAFFRETPAKIKRRKNEGAITVEMEAAALLAVAKFREVQIGLILAGGDDVSGLEWDRRIHMKIAEFQERFFWLGVDTCLEIF